MPKDKSNPRLSSTRDSPYSRPSENTDQCSSKSILELVGDKGEWENTICPVCVEHPHKAVLLICSSHKRGCRPYMCDTSPRLSNCFDQFRERAPRQTVDIGEDLIWSSSIKKLDNKVQCPLCRGRISGWVVVEAARNLMNSKSRNCSLESCEFSGTYKELKKHARCEHPSRRPTDVDPRRELEWMVRETENVEELLGLAVVNNQFDPYAQPLAADLPLDMPYILSSHMHLGLQELSVMNLPGNSTGDHSSGESNSNEDQPQPGSNSNGDHLEPGTNSNEEQLEDQLQPDERQL